MLDAIHGRIAVGWLIVEDLFTVLVLVLLPASPRRSGGAGGGRRRAASAGGRRGCWLTLGAGAGQGGALRRLMLVVGARLVPWLLAQVAPTGSRELFTLAVLAMALGDRLRRGELFGVSFALGAFLAGLVVSESDLSHRAATDALPLRDAFAVLFFVSVGMLFDPAFLLAQPLQVLAVVG